VTDAFGVLVFRRPSYAIVEHWPAYLAFGLLFTWAAGIGRYWDNPRAEMWQQLGLGSLAYVFCLAFFLWLIVLPLRPKVWSYKNVLVFLTLTSPPALLYAVPVERYMSLQSASATNAWFLLFVAAWRVALLVWFLRSIAGLARESVVVATLLPLVLIIVALAALNLEHVVFAIMAGLPSQRTSSDGAYGVIFLLTLLSQIAAPFLLAGYVWRIWRVRRDGPT
jgi:hypothetical protein